MARPPRIDFPAAFVLIDNHFHLLLRAPRANRRLTGLTHRAIGAHYGGVTPAAVSNIRRRLREGQYPLLGLVDRLKGELASGNY